MKGIYLVFAEWCNSENIWIASSNEIPGFVAEADSIEALSTKLQSLVPELLLLNKQATEEQITIEIVARKFVKTQSLEN
jgi:predicted RNase H-like HicB family nuclease